MGKLNADVTFAVMLSVWTLQCPELEVKEKVLNLQEQILMCRVSV